MVLHDDISLTTRPFADALHPRPTVVQIRRFKQKRRQPRVRFAFDLADNILTAICSLVLHDLACDTATLETARALASLAHSL